MAKCTFIIQRFIEPPNVHFIGTLLLPFLVHSYLPILVHCYLPITTTRHFYRNGNPSYLGQFDENGKKDGQWTYFDSAGHLLEVTEFAGSNMKIQTTYFDTLGWMIKEIMYEEGAIDVVYEERNYKDSLLNGPFYRYHPTGTIAQRGVFSNGKRINTEWNDFYNSGQLFREYIFIGEYDWNIKIINIWDEDGKQTVKNGKGKYVTYVYCQNGKARTKIITSYKDGFPTNTKTYKIQTCQ